MTFISLYVCFTTLVNFVDNVCCVISYLCHQFYTVSTGFRYVSESRRVTFKIAVLLWKCVHGAAPAYLQELCVPVEDVRGRPRLRSASTRCIQLPRVRTSTGQRIFAFHGPSIWNSLLSTLRDISLSLRAFKGRLKTYLFSRGLVDNNEHHPALLGRVVIVASSINVETYYVLTQCGVSLT